jgi:hypothetical protein
MLLNSESPLTKPRTQWFDHSLALEGMLVENLPFRGRGRSRLIQYLDVDGDLSDVVQEG